MDKFFRELEKASFYTLYAEELYKLDYQEVANPNSPPLDIAWELAPDETKSRYIEIAFERWKKTREKLEPMNKAELHLKRAIEQYNLERIGNRNMGEWEHADAPTQKAYLDAARYRDENKLPERTFSDMVREKAIEMYEKEHGPVNGINRQDFLMRVPMEHERSLVVKALIQLRIDGGSNFGFRADNVRLDLQTVATVDAIFQALGDAQSLEDIAHVIANRDEFTDLNNEIEEAEEEEWEGDDGEYYTPHEYERSDKITNIKHRYSEEGLHVEIIDRMEDGDLDRILGGDESDVIAEEFLGSYECFAKFYTHELHSSEFDVLNKIERIEMQTCMNGPTVQIVLDYNENEAWVECGSDNGFVRIRDLDDEDNVVDMLKGFLYINE